jgi:dTDP-4-amino-4,6-dideoxygalactose transaminase
LYAQHHARPPAAAFERWKGVTPNFSMRMSNVVAAMARPQLPLIEDRARRWNTSYDAIATGLAKVPGLRLPKRPQAEAYVQSSIQFMVSGLGDAAFAAFLEGCKAKGVFIKWFGAKEPVGFTSQSRSWGYITDPHTPTHTARVLDRLCDIRLPLTLTADDCNQLVAIVAHELERVA